MTGKQNNIVYTYAHKILLGIHRNAVQADLSLLVVYFRICCPCLFDQNCYIFQLNYNGRRKMET